MALPNQIAQDVPGLDPGAGIGRIGEDLGEEEDAQIRVVEERREDEDNFVIEPYAARVWAASQARQTRSMAG